MNSAPLHIDCQWLRSRKMRSARRDCIINELAVESLTLFLAAMNLATACRGTCQMTCVNLRWPVVTNDDLCWAVVTWADLC